MGRQVNGASRTAQKWQVAGNRGTESAADNPSEDEHGGSTRMPSSGGASPSASSTELGRQASNATATDASGVAAANAEKKSAAQIRKEREDRARWADVESDGEEVTVFPGYEHRNTGRTEPEGWATVGKKDRAKGRGKGDIAPASKTRAAKADIAPAAPRSWATEAPRQAAAKQHLEKKWEETAYEAYRPPRHETMRQSHYESSSAHRWEASSWGRGADTWSSSKRGGGGGGWDEGSWGHRQEARSPKPEIHKESFKGNGGFKEKNESFKRGPQVTVTMDRSRLSW